ncbi:MAG TPA: hypothetical protein DCM08_01960 [Microscillaceae bacterium]|jgi:predicted transposase/invertase (TIGR01784 family)|nr:hypothetical protein [Microscillaceae bacterium]
MEELSSSRYINLFTDFGFKRIFGTERNQDLLLDFLNAILEREQDPLVKIEYKDKEQVGRDADERRAVFDLYCENEKGERFIIELQKVLQQHFKDRNLYYATFALQEQAQKGKAWDYALQPVYSIALMNFVFEEAYPDQVISRVEPRERSTNRLFHDKLFFVYVEMPKFKKKFSELAGNLERWLYVFQNMHRLDKAPEEIRKGVF